VISTIDSAQLAELIHTQNAGRAFLAGVNNSKHGCCLTVHASSSSMTRKQSSRLVKYLRSNTGFAHCKVKRYSTSAMARADTLEKFLAPYTHDQLLYDPTGAFARATNLLKFAMEMRHSFGSMVDSLLWHARTSTLCIVFDRNALSADEVSKYQDVVQFEKEIRMILHDTCGAKATDFIKGLRISFNRPSIAATPIDNASLKTPAGFFANIKDSAIFSAMAAAFSIGSIASVGIAHADDPLEVKPALKAVSELNSDIAIAGGDRDGSKTFFAEGAVTFPLGDSFGMRIDGTAGVSNGSFLGGAAGHLFWRDPTKGLLGIAGGYTTAKPKNSIDGSQGTGVFAGEGEWYLDDVTFSGMAGFQFANKDGKDGFIGGLDVEWYPTQDLLLSVGFESNPENNTLGRVGFEYRPGFEAIPGLTFFTEGAFGDNNYNRVYAGIRIFFGPSEALKDRYRYDTFRSNLLSTRVTDSARRYGN